MRPDVATRRWSEDTEGVGAVLSKKLEPSGPSALPNKQSKLEAGIVMSSKRS
jgi:hypothetical protein